MISRFKKLQCWLWDHVPQFRLVRRNHLNDPEIEHVKKKQEEIYRRVRALGITAEVFGRWEQ